MHTTILHGTKKLVLLFIFILLFTVSFYFIERLLNLTDKNMLFNSIFSKADISITIWYLKN